MHKNIFSYSSAYALLIFIGFFDAYSYYFFFGIEISSFMTTGEILTLFFPRSLFILPFIGLIFFLDASRNKYYQNTSALVPKGLISMVNDLKFFIVENKPDLKVVVKVFQFIIRILVIIFFWFGFLMYPFLIGWYLFYTESTYQLFIFDGSLSIQFMLFAVFISIYYQNKKELFTYVILYGLIITILSYIGVNNRNKASQIISGESTHFVSYSTDSKQMSTNSSYFYIGHTKNYLFFRNSIDNSNYIVKIEDINELRIKKITN